MSDQNDEAKRPDELTRRHLLVGAGIAAGAAGAAVAAIPLSRSPFDADYPEVPENCVELPPNGKTVVIIGGGLSGLQAGVELSQRGFHVVILEKTGTPGGKLKSWRDRSFGPPDDPWRQADGWRGYARDHGLHAVWGFYHNLREFLGRHGWKLMEVPENWSIYNFRDKDGRTGSMPISSWPSPYNLLHQMYLLRGMGNVNEDDRTQLARAFRKLATFDYQDQAQREYMDQMTVTEYGRKLGLSGDAIKVWDALIEMAYFSGAHETSALTIANLMQLVAGSPTDLRVNPYVTPAGETFVQPMLDLIRKRGGEVFFNTEVTGIEMANGKVRAVRVAAIPGGPVRRCAICGALVSGEAELGECPFCGARGDQLKLLESADRAEKTFPGDFFVCALDVPAAQRFVGAQRDIFAGPYFDGIMGLHATWVYVVDFWVEGQGAWRNAIRDAAGRPAVNFFATGYDALGITINWTFPFSELGGTGPGLQGEFAGRDIAIIETQVAKAEAMAGLSNQQIADRCWAELRATIPDLPHYRDFYVNRWHHYTGYQPGDESRRPPLQSPIDNLLFIGDLAFVPHPAVFMEKTNVTAKWATNLLLEKIGQAAGRIRILPSGTPSLLVETLRKFSSVYV